MAKIKTTVLAEQIKTFLDNTLEEDWSGLQVGPDRDLQTFIMFDPTTMFEEGRKGIYILPVVREYNLDSSQGRTSFLAVNSNIMIVVCIYYPFENDDLDPNNKDVASWSAVKKIIDMREELENLLIRHKWQVRLLSAEAEAAESIPLGKRAYFSPTMLTFEDHC